MNWMPIATSTSSNDTTLAGGRVQPVKMERIVERDDPSVDVVTLETPNLNSMLSTSPAIIPEFPSTAELMQKCLAVNPFELKFREANRRISHCSDTLLEQNRMAPVTLSLPTAGGITLLKLPSSLAHSPGIFSNINVLSADFDTDNFKTADLSRLVQQMRENSGFSSQNSRISDDGERAPRTADVLNAVLDMHSDRLGTLGFLGQGISVASPVDGTLGSILPSSSALPATISETSSITTTPSTSTGHDTTIDGLSCSPCSSNSVQLISGINSPTLINSPALVARPDSSSSNGPQPAAKKRFTMNSAATSTNVPPASTSSFLNPAANTSAVDRWDMRDVKPIIIERIPQTVLNSLQSSRFIEQEVAFKQEEVLKTVINSTPRSTDNTVVRRPASNSSSHRGRGRNSSTAELPPDERRVTILERNKAAAVRYRKRKKEEHDEIISRVHLLEQEKVALSTQNQVLRRELERLTTMLKAREACCTCRLSGINGDSRRSETPKGDNRVHSPNV